MDALRLAFACVNAAFALVQVAAFALLLAASRRRRVNLALALFLGISAANFAAQAVLLASDDRFLVANASAYAYVTAVAAPFSYLLFVGLAVESPLARWLASPSAQGALLLLTPGAVVALVAAPGPLVDGPIEPGTLAPLGPGAALLYAGVAGLALAAAALATGAALDAMRRATRGSQRRRRAKAYLLAFVLNDVALTLGFLPALVPMPVATAGLFALLVSPLVGIAFVALLLRALLREQLFDFDLKLKTGLRRGLVASAFVGAFFLVEQLVQLVATSALGVLAGIAAAGLLLLAHAPIRRAAERVAATAVPGASDRALHERRFQVFAAQVELALADDGVIDAKERVALERLRESLGLTSEEAAATERDATTLSGARRDASAR